MSAIDGNDGIGYVIVGYLDATGPEGVTAEAEPYSGRPYGTIEEAVAEIDANGGPRADANIVIGAVVPVRLVVQPGETPENIVKRAEEILDNFGSFYASGAEQLVVEAGPGHDAANEALNFKDGALD